VKLAAGRFRVGARLRVRPKRPRTRMGRYRELLSPSIRPLTQSYRPVALVALLQFVVLVGRRFDALEGGE